MKNLQNSEIREERKKPILGRTITKTVLVLGTAGVIGYSMIKDKLLGNPRSKIRKGLFYATLAGFVLYKCQGDKIKEVYDYASEGIVRSYGNFYELKKANNKKINELSEDYRISVEKNIQLEKIVNEYLTRDSIIDALKEDTKIISGQKDSLEKKLNELQVQNGLLSGKIEYYSDEMKVLQSEKKKSEKSVKRTASSRWEDFKNYVKEKGKDSDFFYALDGFL